MRWNPASRWSGKGTGGVPLEIAVVAEAVDGRHLLVGRSEVVTPRRSGEPSTGTGCEGTTAADSSWAESALRALAETPWLGKVSAAPPSSVRKRCWPPASTGSALPQAHGMLGSATDARFAARGWGLYAAEIGLTAACGALYLVLRGLVLLIDAWPGDVMQQPHFLFLRIDGIVTPSRGVLARHTDTH